MDGSNNFNNNIDNSSNDYQNNIYPSNNQYNNYYVNNMNQSNNSYNNYNWYSNYNNQYDNYGNISNDNFNTKNNKKKFNIKNISISIVGIIIFILTFILIKNLTKSYNMIIDLNGASIVANEKLKCKSNYLGHCFLTLPDVKRYDGEVLGFSTNALSHDAEYTINENIEMNNDMKLYVISRKKKSLEIDMSDIDEISSSEEELSCFLYNTDNNECNITVPLFNKKGYQNDGYSETKGGKDITVYPGSIYQTGKKLYPVYSSLFENKTIEVRNSFAINHAYIDVEKLCANEKEKRLTELIKNVEKKLPFLFHNQKIVFHGNENFYKFFDNNSSTHGVTFGDNLLLKSLSIRCGDDVDLLPVLVHELTHSLDYYYKTKTNKMLSDEQDIINLFNKYSEIAKENEKTYSYSINDKPLRFYAYLKNRKEFLSELFAFYYINYVDTDYKLLDIDFEIKTIREGRAEYKQIREAYFRGNFPDDMKKTVEKYICIINNNFDKSKC